jgi:putative transposase
MIGFATSRLTELETETLCGAGCDEHSETRRNGYGDRAWQTKAGTVEIRIPQAAACQLLPRAALNRRHGRSVHSRRRVACRSVRHNGYSKWHLA